MGARILACAADVFRLKTMNLRGYLALNQKNWHVRIPPIMPIFVYSSSLVEELFIDFLVDTAMLLFLMFWQQSTLHVHQSQSVHDGEDMLPPTPAF